MGSNKDFPVIISKNSCVNMVSPKKKLKKVNNLKHFCVGGKSSLKILIKLVAFNRILLISLPK